MASEYRTADWETYRMDMHTPHQVLEPEAAEVTMVDGALTALVAEGILPTATYDHARFALHRRAVAERFEIPWTAITPRMQRLLYAINAIAQPRNMVAAGVFCGNTFVSNAGAAVGPGAVYQAEQLVGIEIVASEAERAERNVRLLDPTGVARVVAADALDIVAAWQGGPIDVLYLDADGAGGRGKGIYLDILETAWSHLAPHALVLAHNSINCATRLADYLRFVRDPAQLRASVNVYLDGEGLEVSQR